MKLLKLGSVLLATMLLANTSTAAFAQSAPAKELADVLASLQKEKSLVFKGKVSQPKNNQGGGMAGVMVIGAGGAPDPFDGSFEVVSNPDAEEFAIVSVRELPGVTIFDNGDDVVNSVTYRDSTFSIKNLAGDLRQILDTENLAKYVSRAKDVKKKSGKQGESIYTCDLSSRMIRAAAPAGGINIPGMNAGVAAIKATITIKDQKLSAMKISVERTNPLREMMNQGAVQVGGPGGADLPPGVEGIMAERMKNPVVVYELTRKEAPAKRTLKQIDAMRELSSEI